MSKVKVQITLEEDLLNQVDDYCDKNYMNRSWLISQSLVEVLNKQKMIYAIANISVSIRQVTESGNIDDDTRREFEKFEALCKIFMGK